MININGHYPVTGAERVVWGGAGAGGKGRGGCLGGGVSTIELRLAVE